MVTQPTTMMIENVFKCYCLSKKIDVVLIRLTLLMRMICTVLACVYLFYDFTMLIDCSLRGLRWGWGYDQTKTSKGQTYLSRYLKVENAKIANSF